MPEIGRASTSEPKVQFYESARDELIQRLALRDQSMIAYIATAGAYFGFIVAPDDGKAHSPSEAAMQLAIMLVLPLISLVFAYMTTQHHVMIGRIGVFTRQLYRDPTSHWDHHYVNWADKRYLAARSLSQGLLLALPGIYVAVESVRLFPLAAQGIGSACLFVLTTAIDGFALWEIFRTQLWAVRCRRETDLIVHSADQLS